MHLLPTYKTVLKRYKAQVRVIKDWTDESILCLQDCFDCTDWEMFKKSCGDDLNEWTDVTCSYIAFCRDMIVPYKQVKIYPNNKPWITKTVKDSLQKKQSCFKGGDIAEQQIAKKDLKIGILKAKRDYKYKLENQMATNNLGSAWDSMKTIAGLQNLKSSSPVTLDGFSSDTELASALIQFYTIVLIFLILVMRSII